MTAALVESYRLAREAQDARFDGYARGASTVTQIAKPAAAGVPGAVREDERRRLRRAERAAERAARREG